MVASGFIQARNSWRTASSKAWSYPRALALGADVLLGTAEMLRSAPTLPPYGASSRTVSPFSSRNRMRA